MFSYFIGPQQNSTPPIIALDMKRWMLRSFLDGDALACDVWRSFRFLMPRSEDLKHLKNTFDACPKSKDYNLAFGTTEVKEVPDIGVI